MVREENTGSRKQTENVASAGIKSRAASLTRLAIGDKVVIRCKDSWANGKWGIVKGFDGEFYHVAHAGCELVAMESLLDKVGL